MLNLLNRIRQNKTVEIVTNYDNVKNDVINTIYVATIQMTLQ